ncbi:D-arabinono-1,4-lactone oxidase [Vulcaniibacterium tengchongense]|uniref:FAD/FMN-containing dehydrogenase n=1 Tax=Vulcaniibacterium tengchongense TaxID=1273429 RepID=A0A3N4VBB1_9GAMM|nr:D-arabinono-1,4-lactone oxidase [Vulcaniibacterium tengchongense]RPE76909.1 FAD/FMN-containing dehydrogenase [Vulcaniibacterium tengchongense]
MAQAWRNWSGSVEARPRRIERPRCEEELAAIVKAAAERGERVRAVGAGHSSSDIVRSEDVLVSMGGLSGVVRADRAACEATVRAGTALEALGKALYEHDLALPNYGDVADQTIGGAIGTGTHGSGRDQPNLSALLLGARLVGSDGRVRRIERTDLHRLRAARVALGTLGVFTELDLKLVPAFDVERREYALGTDAACALLPALVERNRSFDFYWYPRRDDVKLRLVNPVGGGSAAPEGGRLLEKREGYGHQVIPTHSGLPHRFEECEYALPADQGLDCFQEVRARIKARWRRIVAWRVLFRTVAADDAYLSPAHGRATATISLHQNHALPWRGFFADIEPVFRAYGGRPHWGKKHTLEAGALRPLYPHWDDFLAVRAQFDPAGVFLTPALRRLLGVPA